MQEIVDYLKNKFKGSKVDVDDLITYIPKVIKYLKAYGYLKEKTGLTLWDFIAAVKTFQEWFGLIDNDGTLTPLTVRAMEYARCAVPENLEYESITSSKLPKWGIPHLKYHIEEYVPGLTKEEVKAIYRQSFDSISDVCGLTFEEVSSGNNANLIMTTGNRNGLGSSGGTLAYAYLPNNNNFTGQLYSVFDRSELWLGIGNAKTRGIRLLAVHCHECGGHNLGLSHSKDQSALMAAYYNPQVDKPQSDDIKGLVTRYGQPKNVTPTPKPTPVPTTPVIPSSNDETIIRIKGNVQEVSIGGYRVTKL